MRYFLALLAAILLLFMSGCTSTSDSHSKSTAKGFRAEVKESSGGNLQPLNAYFQITFNRLPDRDSLNTKTIFILDVVEKRHLEVLLSLDGLSLTIEPIEVLQPNREYKLVLTNEVKDEDGERLLYVVEYPFITDQRSDTTPPELLATLPNSQTISEFSTFGLQFNENLKLTKSPYLQLQDSSGKIVDGQNIEKGNLLRFIPNGALKLNESYTLLLSEDIQDTFGNGYTGITEWKFTPNTTTIYNSGHTKDKESFEIDEPINTIKRIDDQFYVFAQEKFYALDTKAIKVKFSLPIDGNAYDVVSNGGYYYIAGDRGILVYDAPSDTIVQSIKSPSPIYGIDIHEQSIYASSSSGEVRVFTINDDATLTPNGGFNTDSNSFDILCDKQKFYVANYDEGVAIYDYNNSRIDKIKTLSTARKLHLEDDRLYIVDGLGGVSIYDTISKTTYHIPTLNYTMDLDLAVDKSGANPIIYLYTAEKERGVGVYDVTDLEHIEHISQVSADKALQRSKMDDNDAYGVVTTKDRIIIFNKSGVLNGFSLFPDKQPPTILALSPSNGQTQVALTSDINITFSKPIDITTLEDVAVSYEDGAIEATQSYSSLSNTLTIEPLSPFKEGQWVYVSLKGGIKDLYGNEVEFDTYEYSFRTYTPDTTPPTLLTYYPTSSSKLTEPYSTPIYLQFSEEIDSSTFTKGVELIGSTTIPISLEYNTTTNILNIVPSTPLNNIESGYTIKISDTLTDLSGNSITPQELHFYVSPKDSIKPTIIAYTPDNNSSVFAPYKGDIYIVFSEEIELSTLTNETIKMYTSTLEPIDFTIAYSVTTLKLTPKYPLEADSYTIELSEAIVDKSGNALLYQKLPFKVIEKDTSPPTIITYAPSDGILVAYADNNITLVADELLNGDSINTSNITMIEISSGANVLNSVSSKENNITINMTALSAGESYEVKVQNIADLNGNIMSTPYSVTFTSDY